ncbi:MAG: OmpL47-type beta-barrel domain-containing protein [Thermoproteota archaeon]
MQKVKAALLSLLFLLVFLSVPPIRQVDAAPSTFLVTRVFYSSDDAEVYEGHPNICYGSIPVMRIYYLNSMRLRSFVRFDLSSIPPGSVIDSATLNLFMAKAPSQSRKITCLRVKEPWNESTIAWSNSPSTVAYESIETGVSSNVWLSYRVGPWITAFTSGDLVNYEPNYGWALKDSAEGPKSADEQSDFDFLIEICSKEYSDSSKRPYLEVSYYPPHLELELSNTSVSAYSWAKFTVYRKTHKNDFIYRGALNVKLNTTSANGKFSLTRGGTPITQLTIPDGSYAREFWYYDENAGTCDIHVWTEDYMYSVAAHYGGKIVYIPVMNYGDDTKTLRVSPVIDEIPPITTVLILDPYYHGKYKQNLSIIFVSSLTRLAFYATDNISGVKEIMYRIDESPWRTYEKEFTLSTYSDGCHNMSFFSIDNAGNKENEKVLSVMLDGTPPVISIVSPTGKIILRSALVNFSIGVEDFVSGVKDVELIVDGLPQGKMNKDGSIYNKAVSLSEGSHSWSVEAVDNVNNLSFINCSFTLVIDSTPPSVSDVSIASNTVFMEPVVVTCKAFDEASGVKEVNLYYSSDGGASWAKIKMVSEKNTYSGTMPPQSLFAEIQYYVEAVDSAGNTFKTPIAKYTVGVPVWLYIVVIVAGIMLVAILIKKKSTPKSNMASIR